MSFDDTIHDIWCLMSVETCFLTICNDLRWGFWPKKSHFLGFWRWRKENGAWRWILIILFSLLIQHVDW